EAISIGLRALAEVNIRISIKPSRWQIVKEIILAKKMLERHWTRLEHLDETEDEQTKLILELMFSLIAPAFLGDRTIFAMLSSRFIRYSLRHGSSYVAPAIYAAFGVLLGVAMGEYRTGYRLGELAVRLADRSGVRSVQCKTFVI